MQERVQCHEEETSRQQKQYFQTVTTTHVQYSPVFAVFSRCIVCLIVSVQPCLQHERQLKRSPPQDDVLNGTLRFKRRREDQRGGASCTAPGNSTYVFKEPRGCSQRFDSHILVSNQHHITNQRGWRVRLAAQETARLTLDTVQSQPQICPPLPLVRSSKDEGAAQKLC
jgi:hypothetical protein